MTDTSIRDEAGYLYAACEEIAVSPHGARWDVFDGLNGPCVDTVETAVIQHLEDNYDMPVQMVDGSAWGS